MTGQVSSDILWILFPLAIIFGIIFLNRFLNKRVAKQVALSLAVLGAAGWKKIDKETFFELTADYTTNPTKKGGGKPLFAHFTFRSGLRKEINGRTTVIGMYTYYQPAPTSESYYPVPAFIIFGKLSESIKGTALFRNTMGPFLVPKSAWSEGKKKGKFSSLNTNPEFLGDASSMQKLWEWYQAQSHPRNTVLIDHNKVILASVGEISEKKINKALEAIQSVEQIVVS